MTERDDLPRPADRRTPGTSTCDRCEPRRHLAGVVRLLPLRHRRLPTRAGELGDLQSQLTGCAAAARRGRTADARASGGGNTMDVLRTLTSALGHYDADAGEELGGGQLPQSVRLTAQISSLVVAMVAG